MLPLTSAAAGGTALSTRVAICAPSSARKWSKLAHSVLAVAALSVSCPGFRTCKSVNYASIVTVGQ